MKLVIDANSIFLVLLKAPFTNNQLILKVKYLLEIMLL